MKHYALPGFVLGIIATGAVIAHPALLAVAVVVVTIGLVIMAIGVMNNGH